jgi:hypothetical protein
VQGSCYDCPCVEYRPDTERDPLDDKLLAEAQPELSQHTPICVPCRRNYRCERNGIFVRLGPDAIIDADLYECPGCGHQIVRGFAARAVERYGGSYQTVFANQDATMGDATITDHKGRPITQGQPETEAQQ